MERESLRAVAAARRGETGIKVSDARTAPRPAPWSRPPGSDRSRECRAPASSGRRCRAMPAQPITMAPAPSSSLSARPTSIIFASVPSPDAVSATLMLSGRSLVRRSDQAHLPEIADVPADRALRDRDHAKGFGARQRRQHAAFGDAEHRPVGGLAADMQAGIAVAGDHEGAPTGCRPRRGGAAASPRRRHRPGSRSRRDLRPASRRRSPARRRSRAASRPAPAPGSRAGWSSGLMTRMRGRDMVFSCEATRRMIQQDRRPTRRQRRHAHASIRARGQRRHDPCFHPASAGLRIFRIDTGEFAMTEPAYDLVIRGGRVATASDVFEADVAISGETIVAIGRGLPGAQARDRRAGQTGAARRRRQPCPYRAALGRRHRECRYVRERHRLGGLRRHHHGDLASRPSMSA